MERAGYGAKVCSELVKDLAKSEETDELRRFAS